MGGTPCRLSTSVTYEQNWTIHGIIQNMGYYPPADNPCVMMRENFKTKSYEYIVVYQDDLYIASPTPEYTLNTLQNKYKHHINPEFYLSRWNNDLSTQKIS